MLDRNTQRSRGFGFVIFRDREGLDAAIREKHDAELEGRRVSVKAAIPQDQIPPGASRGLFGWGDAGCVWTGERGGCLCHAAGMLGWSLQSKLTH